VRTVVALLALASLPICGAAADTSADDLLKRAVSLAGSGRLDEAEQLLLEGKAAFVRDARFPVELAGVAWRKKQSARAKAYLRHGLRLAPTDAYANQFLGAMYLLDGNTYATLKYWNRAHRPILNGIVFTPPPPLRPELLARIPAASGGQLLTEARLAQTERNLDRLGVFSAPQFDLTPASNDEFNLAVRAQVLSQPVTGAAGRLLPLLRGLPYQQVNLDWLNIRKRAAILTSLWRWDADKRRIAIKYRAPLARGTYALWTDLRDEKWVLNRIGSQTAGIGVASEALGGEVGFDLGGGKEWTPSFHLSRHTFQRDTFRSDVPASWLANSTIWELRNRLDFPRWRYPERHLSLDSSATLRTGHVFSRTSSRLLGAGFDAAAQWLPQQRDDLYSVRARLRAGVLSGRLPIDELYITAMERDNDLWLRGHVGTREGRKGAAPMGTRFVLTQTEIMRRMLRVPFLRLDAGPWIDVADIGGEPALGSRGWLYDTGAQAVVSTLGGFRFSVFYGRDLRSGSNVLYTVISR
jgi:hypothetical protein